MFPGAGAQIYRNEEGEYDPDDYLPDYDDEPDEDEWEDDGDEPDVHDPAHETGAPPA